MSTLILTSVSGLLRIVCEVQDNQAMLTSRIKRTRSLAELCGRGVWEERLACYEYDSGLSVIRMHLIISFNVYTALSVEGA